MFNFPWSNFHELNLDWILSVVKEAKEVFDDGRSDIDYAVSTADEAKEIATQAAEATIPDNSISTSKLQNSAVTTAKLANNSVTTDKIVDRTIIGNDIAENTIESYNIKNGTIIGADIASDTIERGNLETSLEKEIYGNTLTRFTIENVTDFQRNYYKEQNGVFYIWINVGLPSPISASTMLYDFGSVFHPLFRSYGLCQDNAGHVGVAYIEPDGKLNVTPPTGGSLSSYLYIAITATKNI